MKIYFIFQKKKKKKELTKEMPMKACLTCCLVLPLSFKISSKKLSQEHEIKEWTNAGDICFYYCFLLAWDTLRMYRKGQQKSKNSPAICSKHTPDMLLSSHTSFKIKWKLNSTTNYQLSSLFIDQIDIIFSSDIFDWQWICSCIKISNWWSG